MELSCFTDVLGSPWMTHQIMVSRTNRTAYVWTTMDALVLASGAWKSPSVIRERKHQVNESLSKRETWTLMDALSACVALK